MIIAPGFVAANIFVLLLHLWVDRRLRTDSAVHQMLRIDTSTDAFGWATAPGENDRLSPLLPLIGTASAAVVLAAGETALFTSTSEVPDFWLLSGAIASLVLAVLPFIAAGLLRDALDRRLDLLLVQRANARFAFAFPVLFAAGQIDARSDEIYASLGLRRPAGALERCRQVLLEHAATDQHVAFEALDAARRSAEQDLRALTSLAAEIRAGMTLLERIKGLPDETQAREGAAERVAEAIQSPALADALETGRWSDASLAIERIRPDLDKLSAVAGPDSAMPRSVEDAYRVFDVREDTPLDNIKTILTAYRRIWHPDLARDEGERSLFTLKMQKLNVAWGLIQEARGMITREITAPRID
jgi:hypothetical protein